MRELQRVRRVRDHSSSRTTHGRLATTSQTRPNIWRDSILQVIPSRREGSLCRCNLRAALLPQLVAQVGLIRIDVGPNATGAFVRHFRTFRTELGGGRESLSLNSYPLGERRTHYFDPVLACCSSESPRKVKRPQDCTENLGGDQRAQGRELLNGNAGSDRSTCR